MTAAGQLLDVLEAAGIDTIFGLPGSTEAPLLDEVHRRGVRYVLALHEGVAVSMADGYGRLRGRPGTVALHTSVGTLNGLSQMLNALRDGSPLLVTAGHKDRRVLSDRGFCALPGLLSAVGAVSKWAHQSLSADAVAMDVAYALRAATAPPPGPAYLAVPEDLLAAEPAGDAREAAAVGATPPARLVASPASISAAVDLLCGAEHPMLVAGSGAAGAWDEIDALSRRCGLGVLHAQHTDLGELPVPTSAPSFLGSYGEDPTALAGCDLVVAAGLRLFYPFSAQSVPQLPPGASLVHLSEDPAEVGRGALADVGLGGDVRANLAAMVGELDRRAVDEGRRARRAGRVAELAARRHEACRAERQARSAASPMAVEEVAAVLGELLPEDAVVVEEAVRSSRALLRHMPLGPGQRLLRSTGGALGWGTPAAVGAKLAAPARPVVAIVGDGALQFSVQSLWSAVQMGVAMTVVVLDNGGYLAVKRAIERHVGGAHNADGYPGAAIGGIDHADLARSYGAASVSAGDAESLGKAVSDCLGNNGVSIVHVRVGEVA